MPTEAGGSGGILSRKDAALVRASFGPQLPGSLDLNMARTQQLAAHPLVGKRLAGRIVQLRKKNPIATPAIMSALGGRRRHRSRMTGGTSGCRLGVERGVE